MEADVETVLPLLELDLPLELDVQGLETERPYPTDQPGARAVPGVEVYMRRATPGVVGRGREGPDAHPPIELESDLFEDATGIYVGGHTVPHGPYAPDGLTVVLLRLFGTENLYEQIVLAFGDDYVGDIVLERREV